MAHILKAQMNENSLKFKNSLDRIIEKVRQICQHTATELAPVSFALASCRSFIVY